MEKEIIEAMISSTPRSELGEVQADHEIWEETDGNAHYKVTRNFIPGTRQEGIFLSISGDPRDRLRVIKDFKATLGVPAGGDIRSKDVTHVDIVSWIV